jgi:carboxyl-terminal processing protease
MQGIEKVLGLRARTTRRTFLVLAAGSLVAPPADLALAQSTATPAAESEGAAFDQVWELVRDRFYDRRLRGLDWEAVRSHYRPQLDAAASDDGGASDINRMLDELKASHTRYYTRDDPAYYQLADIFSGALRRRGLERIFPSGEISYPGIGIFTSRDAYGREFVSGVIDGAPAADAGILLGDEILGVDGQPFSPVGSFRGKVGMQASISIRRSAGQAPQLIAVLPANLVPGSMFLRGLQRSARVISGVHGERIGYVHVWSYAGRQYQTALEDLISDGALRDADALILDLRGGWGGAQPQYLDIFNLRGVSMEVTGRDGARESVDVKWRKPAAMLIDATTRSGKEVLAFGFREHGIGALVGTRTEGAVLAATAFLIGDQGLLLLAVEDVMVDGQRLEGVGVDPTIKVDFDYRFAAGVDPQLDSAVQALSFS